MGTQIVNANDLSSLVNMLVEHGLNEATLKLLFSWIRIRLQAGLRREEQKSVYVRRWRDRMAEMGSMKRRRTYQLGLHIGEMMALMQNGFNYLIN
jgi:hypothetical protein